MSEIGKTESPDAADEREAVLIYIRNQVAEMKKWGCSMAPHFVLTRIGEEIERGDHMPAKQEDL